MLARHPVILLIRRKAQQRRLLRADEALVIVRRRIDQMSDDLLARPLAGRARLGGRRVADSAQLRQHSVDRLLQIAGDRCGATHDCSEYMPRTIAPTRAGDVQPGCCFSNSVAMVFTASSTGVFAALSARTRLRRNAKASRCSAIMSPVPYGPCAGTTTFAPSGVN